MDCGIQMFMLRMSLPCEWPPEAEAVLSEDDVEVPLELLKNQPPNIPPEDFELFDPEVVPDVVDQDVDDLDEADEVFMVFLLELMLEGEMEAAL